MPDELVTLAIETSNPSAMADGSAGAVALGAGANLESLRVLGAESLGSTDRHDDGLMSAIDRLCRAAGVPAKSVGRVAVSIGPGGYTAVRIAVATARMISLATGAKCAGVPTARVVARRAPADVADFAVALASKGETANITVFRDRRPTDLPGRLLAAEDLRSLDVRTLIADRFLPAAMRAACHDLGMMVIRPVFDPVACLEASFQVPEQEALTLLPLYPREPEAVTQWRRREGTR